MTDMDRSVKEAARNLGYGELKVEQDKVLFEFLKGRDVFVSLPTGYGKSLCYLVLPRIFDLKRFGSMDPKQSIMIVVSPFLALMKDQVATYSSKGLSVRCVTHETSQSEISKVREGKYQLLFFSPEAFSKRKWLEQLQVEPYRSNIVAFVVDEAQYVKKW